MRYAETGFNLEIDLTRGAETPCPDPGQDVPPDETVSMLDLVGRTEALLVRPGADAAKRRMDDLVRAG